jgi:hypothetical protein
MKEVIDLTGQKFGRLTVLERRGSNKQHNALWLCKCECGKEKIISSINLRKGKSKSCGCLRDMLHEGKNNPSYKHGESKSRIYHILAGMIQRCDNSNCKAYKNYGDRGIKVCNEWKDKENGFINFYNWAIANGYDKGLTIDRIDNNGNYEPNNCRWSNRLEQNNNKRNTKKIVYNEKTYTIMELSKKFNIKYETLLSRYKKGWDIEKIIVCPKKEV